jgi:hypothetical protein
MTARIIADARAETDDCERCTPGCSIDHTAELQRDRSSDSTCETW